MIRKAFHSFIEHCIKSTEGVEGFVLRDFQNWVELVFIKRIDIPAEFGNFEFIQVYSPRICGSVPVGVLHFYNRLEN